MKMRLSFSIFFLTTFFGFRFLSFAQDIHFNLFTRSQVNIGSIVTGMSQDPQGYLWFATAFGLYKYDGHQYTGYRNEPINKNSPAEDNIQHVATDKEGNVWLGTRQSGLDRLDPSTGIFTHFRHNNNDPGSLADD